MVLWKNIAFSVVCQIFVVHNLIVMAITALGHLKVFQNGCILKFNVSGCTKIMFSYREKQRLCMLLSLSHSSTELHAVCWSPDLQFSLYVLCVCAHLKHAPWDWLCEHFQGLWPSLCCLDFLGSYYIAHPSILTTHGWLAARTAAMGGESWIVSLHLWKHALPWLSFLLSFLPFLV